MLNYKLQIDDFGQIDYNLLAIHTALEDYRLAYFINKSLPINLSKCNNEIAISSADGETFFTKFSFADTANDILWTLIENESRIDLSKNLHSFDLFANTDQKILKKVYLLPEFKKVNFFLKIENPDTIIDIKKTTAVLNTISNVATVYNIDYHTIKNKNNLIF